MKNTLKRWAYRFAVIGASSLAVLLSPQAFPAETPEQGVAKAVSVQGTVEVRRAGQTQWQPVKLNDTFSPGDSIRVGERSRADLQLLNQSVLRLNANSSLTVEAPKEARTGVVDLVRGAVHFFSRGPNSLEVKTPFTVAGVRGTEFLVSLEPKATLLTVFEGTVDAQSPAGSLTLRDGQSAIAEAGKVPVTRVVARPRDAVHWALYYPPVIQDRQAPTYRAQTLLAVGAVDEARTDIQRALQTAPNNADALSLQSIMTLVQGDKDDALRIAQAAVDTAPQSATALIARSHALQARFDLAGARADVEKAVELDPRNALAWARLAELQSSFGELDKATAAAERAVALEPNLSRTQTVLGFAHLTSIRTKQARDAFEKAIAFDQADPLPRLGLGLAKIRDGELEAGGRDIEVAASLDPNNSLVRSYLGKVYYEEKRTGLDEREYAVAKQLDPKDPTPWFYDAIAKQTTNRPVEAMQDMEKAIELNDNRAVYRSELLLDSDAAARSASQARIYSDLGFQQLALVEGWKSVNFDPSNFSAHRFLADSYSALPRHQIARVSELLQSQLLQPNNITPIQPRLAESNLFLISAGGPGVSSFNEFNPLFNRDGMTLQASALAGENSTWAGEGIVAGIHKNASFSLGGYGFNTDGFRINNDQSDKIGNAFLQLELSPQTGVQAEYRYRKTERGDLQLNFFRDDVLPNLKRTTQENTYRVGARHAFSPSSIILGSLTYQDRDFLDHDEPDFSFLPLFETKTNAKSTGAELQHQFRSQRVNTVFGVGYFDTKPKDNTTTVLVFDPLLAPVTINDTVDPDVKHTNVYLYSYIKVQNNLTLTLGASGDYYKSDGNITTTITDPDGLIGGNSVSTAATSQSEDQINPKFGITWNPLPATTIRAAAFRAFKRTLITNQTLEPTQVAGFNQFYDDLNLTKSWRYGVALDQKVSRTIFAGVEYSARDLEIPITIGSNTVTGDGKESLGRAYFFWTPQQWLALSAEYQAEQFRNDDIVAINYKKVTTQRIPFGLRVFHSSGLSAALRATYYDQTGDFVRRGTVCCATLESGSSDFWLVDLGISYRLPRRSGFVTVGAANLFDRNFQYQETDLFNTYIQPARAAFVKLALTLQ